MRSNDHNKKFTPLSIIKLYKTITKLQIKSPNPKFDKTIPGCVLPFWTLQQGLTCQPKTKSKNETRLPRLGILCKISFFVIAISCACKKRSTLITGGKRASCMIDSKLMEAIRFSSMKMCRLTWLLTSKMEPHQRESPYLSCALSHSC